MENRDELVLEEGQFRIVLYRDMWGKLEINISYGADNVTMPIRHLLALIKASEAIQNRIDAIMKEENARQMLGRGQ